MAAFDRIGVATRLRGLLVGQDGGNIVATAERLGVEEVSLRMSIDEESPHPTVEVLAAVVRECGVDPSWLLTGVYDPGTHRSSMEDNAATTDAFRVFMNKRAHISEPTSEPLHLRDLH